MNDHQRPRQLIFLTGIALISLAGMALEITLTRVFSVLFFYHYVFAILSIAMLGVGLGAALVYQRGTAPTRGRALLRAQNLTLLCSVAVLGLAVVVVATAPIDGRLLLAAAAAIPYLLLGMTLATLFGAWPEASPTLYGADLSGAGLGAAAAIPLLNWLGGLDALLFTALLFVAGSLLFGLARGQPMARLQVIGAGVMALVIAVTLALGGLDLDMRRLATPKPLTQQLQESPESQIVFTRWDAFARTDLLESSAEPWRKQVYINGAAGSIMPRLPATVDEERRLTNDLGYFPFQQWPATSSAPSRVFVIGPGGGKDVLFALVAGSQNITAVEVSPGVVQAVRHYAEYNGGLFDHPYVTVVVDEGRSYLRRSGAQFDLISLSEVIALTAERGSYILAENYVYTVEALHDYLDALAPGGRIALKLYDEYTLTRAFTTAVAALRERGLDEAAATRCMTVVLDPRLLSEQAPLRGPLLIVHRDPVSPQAAEELLGAIEQAGYIPLFVPHVHERPPLSGLTSGQTTLEELVDGFSRADISPTTDDRPFFYEFRRGLPEVLRQLLAVLGTLAALGLIYLAWRRRSMPGAFWSLVLYFALLGVGFMLVELAVIQQLTLFLGHPTTALTVGLFAALVSSGLGSLAGGRLGSGRTERTLLVAAFLSGLLALAYTGSVPLLTGTLLNLSLPLRIAVAAAVVFPLFFALGMPFPLGLQVAERQSGPLMIPLVWGVNGVTSVIGSAGGIALAILWGFDTVLAAGGLVYLAIALLVWRTTP